jgi:superfamily II RNA helicase
MVCAHTGSGKTVLALYAIARCLALGKRVIYVSPIKTLSNQKYKEFGEAFQGRVGILTGDIKINPEAACLIMTAEILRNFLIMKDDNIPSYFSMEDVSCVVLDEVHFINNQERGRVWEEIIVHLHREVQLVMLSATLSSPLAFVGWIGKMKQVMCHLVLTERRPVPLKHTLYWDDQLHIFLENETRWHHGVIGNVAARAEKYYKGRPWTSHLYLECMDFLEKQELLPATVFLLNRDLVEKQARSMRPMQTDHVKVARIDELWRRHLHKYAECYETTEQWNMVKELLQKGIGIHHSGMIPILKEIVEIVYTEGLVPVLLATETFALGVNAPTKTTVFTNLQKYDGKTRRALYTDEYLQMAGRAGRRGLDLSGTIVILPHPYMLSETTLREIITAPPKIIESRLSVDFTVILSNIDAKQQFPTSPQTQDVLKNTLFYLQQDRLSMDQFSARQSSLTLQIPEDPSEDPEHEKLFEELQTCEKKLVPDGYIRLDKKTEKKYRKRISEIRRLVPEEILKLISRRREGLRRRAELDSELEYHNKRWQLQVTVLHTFLKKEGFMIEEEKENKRVTLTRRGVLLRSIHEGNGMLISRLLDSEYFTQENEQWLSPSSMIAIFSMFVADKEREKESVRWEDVVFESKEEERCARSLYEWADEYRSKEMDLVKNLPFQFLQDWDLSRTMMRCARDWYEGKPWHEIRYYYKDFEGNFIKNIMRLTNFVQSLFQVAKILHIAPILQNFENIQEKMIRDIVINDSLYITPVSS